MKGYNDDLIMSLAIGSWLADSNSNTYNITQIKQADAILKGMELNKTNINKSPVSPFYNSKEKTVDPFLPVYMSDSQFEGDKQSSRKNPLGDLSWLIGK